VSEPLPPEDPRDALIREQAARLAAQDEQIAGHGERIAALGALVAGLREQLDAALRAASGNSGNSSMPPSADDLPGRRPPARRERRAAERAEKNRKPGKQPGSPGAAMRWRKADKVTGHFPRGDCECGADLAGAADLGVARSYQQEDVPEPQPSRRYQHDLHKARCACGRVHVAPRPAGVPDAPLSAGPRLSAMAVYLSVFQHVPVERAQLLISDLTGGVVSAGFVHSCLGKAAGLVSDAVRLIRTLIAAAPVAGFDETTLRSGPAGDKKYVHGAFTELYSAFHLGTRSLETMKEAGILPSFAGIAVTDRYRGYYSQTRETSPGARHAQRISLATSPTSPRPTPAPAGRSRPSGRCAASSARGTPPAGRDFPPFPLESASRWRPSSGAPSRSARPPSPASPARRPR
jgi:transposase